MAGTLGIKESKELLVGVAETVGLYKRVMEDDRVTLGDLGAVLAVLPKLEAALVNVKDVPKELLQDLQVEEEVELLNAAASVLNISVDDPKLREKAYAFIRAGLALCQAISLV